MLHLRYTAQDGGSGFRQVVESARRSMADDMVLDASRTGLFQAYSLRQHFPDGWWRLRQTGAADLTLGLQRLPYLVRGHQPVIDSVVWLGRVSGAPATFPITVGAVPVNLNRDTAMGGLCVGSSPPFALGTTQHLAATADDLEDLTILMHHKINT